jgi:branched-chain amino acid transport system ATP-binding protein
VKILELKDLMVFYENAIAINNVAMKCEKGLVTGIFGANSAGKSTLMYTISGIILDVKRKEAMKGGERITILGSVLYEGKDITKVEPSERARMGIVLCPERRRIFQESTVLENLKIGGILATKAQGKKTMEYVFNLFPHLKSLKKREGGFLSGGEQQMLAIGRALMAKPKMIIMDEPSMGLSPKLVNEVFEIISRVSHIGIPIFFVEQNLRKALSIADRGYILNGGQIVLQDSAKSLLKNENVIKAYLGEE